MFQIASSGRSLMYSRKILGPRMEPSGTPTFTEYSCDDFPFKTTQSRLLLKNTK